MVVVAEQSNWLTSAVQVKVNRPAGKVYGFGELTVTALAVPIAAVPVHV